MLDWLKAILGESYTEEIDKKISEEIGKGFVARSDFNTLNTDKKMLTDAVKERDKQLEMLKTSAGNNDTLQKQIADLQKENADQQKAHAAEIAKLKLNTALDLALSEAKAKNSTAVKAMLDISKVTLDEEGKLSGFFEQLEALKKSDGYMFDSDEKPQPQFAGFQPGASTTASVSAQAGFESRLAEARKNNNTLEVIKIKREAASEGVVLL